MAFEIDGGGGFDAQVVDLSVGGAFVEAEPSPAMGTKVLLRIEMPSGQELAVGGIVRWVKPEGIGVQFGLLGVRETYALTEFLAGLGPMPDSRRP